MHIGHILNLKGWHVITLAPRSKIADAAALLAKENIGIAVIVDNDTAILGVISERDIVRGVTQRGVGILDMQVEELMTTEIVTCAPDTSVRDVLQMMATHEFRHIPIVTDDKVVGVVSMRDVVDTRLGELETENESLRQLLTDAA
jgi:CBS domain-containing protein